jgi:hypothetical protein
MFVSTAFRNVLRAYTASHPVKMAGPFLCGRSAQGVNQKLAFPIADILYGVRL